MIADNESNSTAGDASASPALRYVVLRHDGIPDPHFDLMFELQPGAPLTTWRSPLWPIDRRVILTPLPPHRRDYLDYEGPVSGGRGYVTRVAFGSFLLSMPDAETWELRLDGSTAQQLSLRMRRDTSGVAAWDATAI
jgi:hypothetical protein